MLCLRGLGVTSFNHRVLLFNCHLLEKKRNTFQIAVSKNGFDFVNFKKWGEIVKKQGKQEKVKDCQDFRISKTEASYFLTYKIRQGKSYRLCGAFWGGFSHWQKTGEMADIKETGMVVPRYRYQGKYILYFGEKAIRIAQSADLVNWRVLDKPIFTLPEKLLKKGVRLKIGTFIPTEEGILLIYYFYQNSRRPRDYSLKAIIFDKNNPGKILEELSEPIWQQGENWKDKTVYPLGIVKIKQRLIAYWQTSKGEIFALHCPYFKLGTSFLEKSRFFPLLRKFIKNPILKPQKEHRWESKAVFNAAADYDGKKVRFIYRAVGDDDVSVWGYASTKDGFHIDERLKEPIYAPGQSFEGGLANFQQPGLPFYLSGGGGFGGCEDPRITKIGDRFYVIYVAFDGGSPPRLAITSIDEEDFLAHRWSWEKPVLISPPGIVDKSGCLLPEKIKGQYVIFHRVFPDILIDFVESLDFDGKTFLKGEYKIPPRQNCWDSRKIGVGATPIKTDDGWLVVYNAVDDKDDSRYKIGAMLLKINDPTRVRYRCAEPVLEPTEPYENEGLKYGVVYPCGAAVIDKTLFVYYGASDETVALSTAPLNEFLNKLKSTGMPKLTSRFERVNLW